MQVNKENYLQVAKEATDQLLACAKSDDWKHEKSKDGVEVFKGKTDDGSVLIKGEGLVEGTVVSILDQISDTEKNAKALDSAVHLAKIIERYDTDHKFIYQQNKMPFPVSSRDFVTFQSRQMVSPDLGVGLATSCVHGDAPEEKKCVRGIIHIAGYIVEKHDDKQCKVTFVLRVDLKGMVPVFAVKSASLEQGFRILHLRKIMESS